MVFMQNNNFQNVSSHTKCQWLYNKYKCRWQYVLCKPQSEVVRSGKKRQEYISVIHILQAADGYTPPLSSAHTHTHSLTIPSILPTTSQHTHMHMHLFYMQITLQSEPYCLAQFFQDLHIFFFTYFVFKKWIVYRENDKRLLARAGPTFNTRP